MGKKNKEKVDSDAPAAPPSKVSYMSKKAAAMAYGEVDDFID